MIMDENYIMFDINAAFLRLKNLAERLATLRAIFEIEPKKVRLNEVLRKLENPILWKDIEQAQVLGKERSQLENIIATYERLASSLEDGKEMLQLISEENDEEGFAALMKDVDKIEQEINAMEFRRKFSHEMDNHNAYMDIQSGSGGTEAQDWAEMLLRMYLRFGDRHDFKTQIIEISPGEVAGIKSATIKFTGDYAYGWLRTETGVHRLVRKSPFDASNKRHTSFASVFVSPEIEDDVEIEINPADVRIDTYRASGAGGQHVNVTDSAVRITHYPTGIVVQCQNERSQHKNRAQAMKQLRAKLYELDIRKKEAEKSALEATKKEITWGSQIRSYVLDASRIKDLRTGIEIRTPQTVLDGDLDLFIEANLLRD